MKLYIIILLLFIYYHPVYSQFVNPNSDNDDRGASQNFENPSSASPASESQPRANTGQSAPQPPVQQSAAQTPGSTAASQQAETRRLMEQRIRQRTKYFQQMVFTFDGKIQLLKESENRPSTGYIAFYDPQGRLSSIQYDGKRPFDIFMKYSADGKKEEFLWQHIGQNVMKYDYLKNRFFIIMQLFNFIRDNNTLVIDEMTESKVKYFSNINRDRHAIITPINEISESAARSSQEYYAVYYNKAGNWYCVQYYQLKQNTFRLMNAYYAVYHPDGEIRNLRIHDVDSDQNDMIYLYRSYFYEYNPEKKVVLWELYIREENEIWEILYEKWNYGWENDRSKLLSRTNIFTDDYLSSVFASIHILPFLNRNDSFFKQSEYLSGLGMSASRPAFLGSIIGLFIPVIKNLFINIEIGWDGMWQKGENFRYTLNAFTLSVSGFYIIPVYQDTYALGIYVGGGIGVIVADFTQVYNDPLYTLAKQRASASGLLGNVRLGFCIVWNSGIFGAGLRYFIGKLNNFTEGKGVLYQTPSDGLRLLDADTEPAGSEKASLNMYRFSIEIFFGFRL